MSNPVTITITGKLDFDQVATIAMQLDVSRRVILDITQAKGGSSTHIAICIQVAAITGQPVTVRGCNERFSQALTQMRLGHLIKTQPWSAEPEERRIREGMCA